MIQLGAASFNDVAPSCLEESRSRNYGSRAPKGAAIHFFRV